MKKIKIRIEYPADADNREYKKSIGKVMLAIMPALRKLRKEHDLEIKTTVNRAKP